MTPSSIHYGHAQALRDVRQTALDAASLASPTRFKGCRPQPPALPEAARIIPPPSDTGDPKATACCAINS